MKSFYKRLFAACECAAVMFAVLICSTALAISNNTYAQGAHQQAAYSIEIDSGRGNFYDKNFIQLTGDTAKTYALLQPGENTYRTLFKKVSAENKVLFYRCIQGAKPFLMPLEGYSDDIITVQKTVRYRPVAIAAHLIGYVNSSEKGVSGLEKACNDMLINGADTRTAAGLADASGSMLGTARIETQSGSGAGIMLTIDSVYQRICESIAAQYMDAGAIVVMDAASGRVLASVSVPIFYPDNLAASTGEGCFINRAISAYNVGSVFKPLLVAAALENGVDPEETFECTGSIEIGGHIYRCAYGKGHGEVNMQKALEESCNCYFITLGNTLGSSTVLKYAKNTGFAQSTQIYGTMRTASGTLPSADAAKDRGELSMLSFGQGQLTASPVQVAAMFNAIANGGVYISPSFVEGEVNAYTRTIDKSLYAPIMRRAMHENTAKAVQIMLAGVVKNGLGKSAAPQRLTAAGKTGTAQTGRYSEEGSEIMDAWFAGFYPAENPQITVAVMLDSGTSQGDDAAKIFAQVVNQLSFFM